MAKPAIKVVVMGEAGTGKTTLAATFPTPILVHNFDSRGKDFPYLRRGNVQPLEALQIGDATIPMQRATNGNGRTIVQVEHYQNANAKNPTAYPLFQARVSQLESEYNQWNTVVVDSVTLMELAARKYCQYVLNPTSRDPRQFWGGATDLLEEFLCIQVGALPMNVVIICHVEVEKDEITGGMIRNPKAPGRLSRSLPAVAVELYRSFIAPPDSEGRREYQLQTQADHLFNCATRIGAPNPCTPHYKALWVNSKIQVEAEKE